MSNDVLEKVKQLPIDKQQQVEEFVDYLLHKYTPVEPTDMKVLAEQRRKLAGSVKGGYWMADDFNDTPEEFKDYIQ